MTDALIVAMDGPSGSGKSSTARGVAVKLALDYLDTGAMYRAMTWALVQNGVDIGDSAAVASAAPEVSLVSGIDPLRPTIEANGTDVSTAIREPAITAAVSSVSAVPAVREILVAKQRKIIDASAGIVVEGRDIGSTVAPNATVKVYLVADVAARAQRRTAELGGAEVEATQDELTRRDHKDSSRSASPLAMAEDAIIVDSTHLTLGEVIATVVALVSDAS